MKQRLVKWLAAAVLAVGCTTLTAGCVYRYGKPLGGERHQ